MIAKLFLAFRGLFAEPYEAIELAAQYEDAPALTQELLAIASRESNLKPTSVHSIDSWASKKAWQRAMKKGWLSPWCPFHMRTSGWATRGNFGLFAAYNLRYLGLTCAPASLLDNAFLSAVISIRKMRHVCQEYGACDPMERRLVWSGLKVYYANR